MPQNSVEWLLATPKAGNDWDVRSLGVFRDPAFGPPTFANDGRSVYFHAVLPGGQGKNDLWQMRRVPTAKALADRERKAAELLHPHWYLGLVAPDGRVLDFGLPPDKPLPAEPFRVVSVFQYSRPQDGAAARDTFWRVAPDLPHLSALKDHFNQLDWSETRLAHLAAAPFRDQLTTLIASGLKPVPAALAELKRFPKLINLQCDASEIDDDALAQLAKDLPGLTSLGLGGSGKRVR